MPNSSFGDPTTPLADHTRIAPDQAAAIRRLIARQPADHHDDLLAVLGLDAPTDQADNAS